MVEKRRDSARARQRAREKTSEGGHTCERDVASGSEREGKRESEGARGSERERGKAKGSEREKANEVES